MNPFRKLLVLFAVLFCCATAYARADTATPDMVVQKALSRIRKADIPTLAQTYPYKADAYLGVAAAVERYKRFVELKNTKVADQIAREIDARLDILETGKINSPDPGFYSLLQLTADPESQVLVEYTNRVEEAWVTFNWGPIPLVNARVVEYPSPEVTYKGLIGDRNWGMLPDPLQRTTVDGRQATIRLRTYTFRPISIDDYDPNTQIITYYDSNKTTLLTSIGRFTEIRADAVVILPNTPPAVRAMMEKTALTMGKPLISPADIGKYKKYIIAGDPRTDKKFGYLKKKVFVAGDINSNQELRIADGKRVIFLVAPSIAIAEQAARLIMAGQPIKPSDVDGIRKQIVELLGSSAAEAKPTSDKLFIGDLHTHTFYGGDDNSPVNVGLAAIYCYTDFIAITDHNAIRGAQMASTLFPQFNSPFSIIVGQEITATDYHMNAYPLNKPISHKLTPEQAIKAAKDQNATIQWNHPGYPGTQNKWSMDHLKNGILGTGLHAWENPPNDEYEAWKAAGKLPTFVGGTDTHSAVFGYGQRTIVLAPSRSPQDIANAVRAGKSAALVQNGSEWLYGSKDVVSLAWNVLSAGDLWKKSKAQQIREDIGKLDIIGLINASKPKDTGEVKAKK